MPRGHCNPKEREPDSLPAIPSPRLFLVVRLLLAHSISSTSRTLLEGPLVLNSVKDRHISLPLSLSPAHGTNTSAKRLVTTGIWHWTCLLIQPSYSATSPSASTSVAEARISEHGLALWSEPLTTTSVQQPSQSRPSPSGGYSRASKKYTRTGKIGRVSNVTYLSTYLSPPGPVDRR